jgi:RHS repeat-associated protein
MSILSSYQFTLDGNGNRTNVAQNEPLTPTLPTDTISYTYNTQKNRLLTAGAFSFTYDFEGQLNTGYSATYTFDYEHRLKTIGSDIQFYYDGSGNRLKAIRSGVETRYIYDAGGNLLAEADGSNVITRYYIHGAGLLAMVVPGTPDQVYTYHYNAVGSTIAMTDSGQNVVNKYSYDAFGKVLNQIEAVPQPFKFVGQFGVMTEPNGFYYMRARYYDPEVGRFISEDPIGFEGGDVNLCAYAGNNPVLLVDPLGLEPPKNIPPGVSIAANVDKARNMTIFEFYNAVKSGGKWDYKQLDPAKYEDFGNYNYGVAGRAAGFGEYELKTAAGAYQMYSGTSDIDWLLPWSKTYAYGDDPNDQKWINEGIRDYESYYGKWHGCSGSW